MLSIQDLGLSILGDAPKNFYILGGSEYGIKDRYIEVLVSKVGPKLEYANVLDVVDLMSRCQLLPLPDQVYVVRYDNSFLSALTKDLAEKILRLDIIGTLILIYEDDKAVAKLDKFFPDNTAIVSDIDVKHMEKYLKSDFPDLDKKTIEYAAKNAENYYHAKNICRCLNVIRGDTLLTEKQMISLFGIQNAYSTDDIQAAIANRDFNSLMKILESYDGDLQNILYQILRTMIELDKCFDGKYVNSPLKKSVKHWSRSDVYWMFNHTYDAITSLRSGYAVDVSDLVIYLGALMTFRQVPETRLLK